MPALRTVFQAEAWRVALEKYGAAMSMTVGVYELPAVLILGPVHPTLIFEAVNLGREGPTMFADCVRQCMVQTDTPTIIDDYGVAVIGISLTVAGETLGALVAGYALTAFPEEATVSLFARKHGLSLSPVWRAMRRQPPLTKPRLDLYAELLAALAETL